METKDMIKLLNERGHYAREVGCEVLGVPDIVACVSGWFVAIENKRTGGRVSPLQEAHRIQILHDNGLALVDPEESDLMEMLNFLEGNPGGRVRQAEYQGGTHAGPRPHVRRGHWYGYWTGPRDGQRRFSYRWLAPMLVAAAEGSGDE